MRGRISAGSVNIANSIKHLQKNHVKDYDEAVLCKQEARGRKVSMRLACVSDVITKSDSTLDGQKAALHKEESILAAVEEMLMNGELKGVHL